MLKTSDSQRLPKGDDARSCKTHLQLSFRLLRCPFIYHGIRATHIITITYWYLSTTAAVTGVSFARTHESQGQTEAEVYRETGKDFELWLYSQQSCNSSACSSISSKQELLFCVCGSLWWRNDEEATPPVKAKRARLLRGLGSACIGSSTVSASTSLRSLGSGKMSLIWVCTG